MFSYTTQKRLKTQKYKKIYTLQARTLGSIFQIISAKYKRALLSALQNKGSVTIETALLLPIFLFFIIGILQLGNCILVDEEIGKGVVESARYYAKVEAPQGQLLLVSSTFKKNVDTSYLNKSNLEQGVSGISFLGTHYDDQESMIVIKASYRLRIEMPMIGSQVIELNKQIRQKVFCGYDYHNLDEETDIFVYVAENKSVYHTNRDCTHLVLSIQKVFAVAEYLSGNTGYSPCELCIKVSTAEHSELYITNEGNRYHSSISCSGLKRTVVRVRLSQVGGLGKCQRCGVKTAQSP